METVVGLSFEKVQNAPVLPNISQTYPLYFNETLLNFGETLRQKTNPS